MIKRGLHKTLAEVGKIKTGYRGEARQSAGGKTFAPPKKLDHFIITTTERGADGNLKQNDALMATLGDKPRELKIRLPFDSIDKNFFTQFQAYDGGRRVCSGDGIEADRRGEVSISGPADKPSLVVKGEAPARVPCDPDTCPILAAGKCKVSGILSCFLPQSGDLGGVYKFRTHSWNAVSSILAALEFFAANTGGILQGMPLKLVLVKKTTEDHGTITYATVVLDGEEIHGLRRLAIEERDSRKMLGYDIAATEAAAEAEGFFEDHDDEGEVEAEFYVEDAPAGKGTGAVDLRDRLEARRAEQATTAASASATPPASAARPSAPAPRVAPPAPRGQTAADAPGDFGGTKPAEDQETIPAAPPAQAAPPMSHGVPAGNAHAAETTGPSGSPRGPKTTAPAPRAAPAPAKPQPDLGSAAAEEDAIF